MRLTIVAPPELSGASWSVEAQPTWNVLFLKQLACHHFDLLPADAFLSLLPGNSDDVGSVLDNEDAVLAEFSGISDGTWLELRCRSRGVRHRLSPGLWVFCYDCEAARPAAVAAACVECGARAAAGWSWQPVSDAIGDCATCGRRGCRFQLEVACAASGAADDAAEGALAAPAGTPHPTGRCVPIRELTSASSDGCCVCSDSPQCGRPLLAFPCGHAACLPCFVSDATCRLADQRLPYLTDRGLTIDCPADCRHPNRYLADAHAFRLLGAEAYERVKLLGAQRALLAAEAGHVMCPVCAGQYELPANGPVDAGEVTCDLGLGGCGARICLACRALAHAGACASADIAGGSGGGDSERQSSLTTIQRTSKPCPRCRAPTERDGGCMHLTCRLCGLGWCWICCLEWSQRCQTSHWFG